MQQNLCSSSSLKLLREGFRQKKTLNNSPVFSLMRVCFCFLPVVSSSASFESNHNLPHSSSVSHIGAAACRHSAVISAHFHIDCLRFLSDQALWSGGNSSGWKSHQYHHWQDSEGRSQSPTPSLFLTNYSSVYSKFCPFLSLLVSTYWNSHANPRWTLRQTRSPCTAGTLRQARGSVKRRMNQTYPRLCCT